MTDKDLIKQWAKHPMLLNESKCSTFYNRIVSKICQHYKYNIGVYFKIPDDHYDAKTYWRDVMRNGDKACLKSIDWRHMTNNNPWEQIMDYLDSSEFNDIVIDQLADKYLPDDEEVYGYASEEAFSITESLQMIADAFCEKMPSTANYKECYNFLSRDEDDGFSREFYGTTGLVLPLAYGYDNNDDPVLWIILYKSAN